MASLLFQSDSFFLIRKPEKRLYTWNPLVVVFRTMTPGYPIVLMKLANWLNQTTSSYHIFIVFHCSSHTSTWILIASLGANWPTKMVALPTTSHVVVATTTPLSPWGVPTCSTFRRILTWQRYVDGCGLLKVAYKPRLGEIPWPFLQRMKVTFLLLYGVSIYTSIYIYTSNLNHQLTVGWHSIYTVLSICPEDMDTALGFPVISGILSTNFTWVVVSSHFNMFVKMGIFTKI